MTDSFTFWKNIAASEIDAMDGYCSNCFSETRKWTEEEIIAAKNERGMAADEPFERWCDACLNLDMLSPLLMGGGNKASERNEPPSTSQPETLRASGLDTTGGASPSPSPEVDGGYTQIIANSTDGGEITQNAFFVHISETEIALMAGKCISCGGQMKIYTAAQIIEIKNELGLAAEEPLEWWCDACLRKANIPTGEPMPKCEVIPFPCNRIHQKGA